MGKFEEENEEVEDEDEERPSVAVVSIFILDRALLMARAFSKYLGGIDMRRRENDQRLGERETTAR
jgi:hypothetical protein